MRTRIAVAHSFLFLALSAGDSGAAEPGPKPNVVIILADDLAWADLGCYGNRFHETPHIDRLAKQGMRFTRFYAGPVCSPTRANLQSGQDQARFGITQHIPGHRRPFAKLADPVVPDHLPLAVETFAERLAAAGYATGYFGKWHLGGADHGPDRQGWKTALVRQGNTAPAAAAGAADRRAAAFLADKAVEFIQAHRREPFLLQVSPSAVHIPLSTTPELLKKYRAKKPVPGSPCRPEYAGLLEELDECVGRVAAEIDRLGLGERTLILFLSDNGGLEHEQGGRVVTSNAPLRGEKGTLYEGGVRVPAVARWPGRVPAGAACDVPATTHDIYPTLLELAGATAPAKQPLDGVSMAPLLKDPKAAVRREALYWHLPHYHHSTPAGAIRRGDWKLIEFFETGDLELYDLAADPGERTNLAKQKREKAAELRDALAAWRTRVGARMPKPNPNYDPARAGELAKGRDRKENK